MADEEDLETCVSAKRTGLKIDDFYVEQSNYKSVVMREQEIPIRFVWNGMSVTAAGDCQRRWCWRLAGAEAGEDDGESAGEDFQVEPEGPVVDVL